MQNKANLTGNIDLSDPSNYPNGKLQDNDGSGNGTPVNFFTQNDIQETAYKLLRLYGININDLPDNETNGYQIIEGLISLASKNDYIVDLTEDTGRLSVSFKLGKLLTNESFILKATVNKGSEVDLVGSDGVEKPIIFVGDFLIGEYVRFVNEGVSVRLERLIGNDLINPSLAILNEVKMYAGDINLIPNGWYLCDGSNNTIDLRGKFIAGYSGSGDYENIGDTAGASSFSLTESQLPPHQHKMFQNSDSATALSSFPDRTPTKQGSFAGENNYVIGASVNPATLGNTSAVGSGDSIDNRPEFVVLAYIQYKGVI